MVYKKNLLLFQKNRVFFGTQEVYTLVFQGQFNEEQLEMMKNLHNGCVAQTGASEGNKIRNFGNCTIYRSFFADLIAECGKGNFQDDPKLKCYFKCVFDEMGVVSISTLLPLLFIINYLVKIHLKIPIKHSKISAYI